MSYQNYDNFQNQHGSQEQPVPNQAAPQPDSLMPGQQPDSSPAQYQGAPPGEMGAPQQGGDAKTTLWYVSVFCSRYTRDYYESYTAYCSLLARHVPDLIEYRS